MSTKKQLAIILTLLSLVFLALSLIMLFNYTSFLVPGYKSVISQKNHGGEVGLTVLKLISGWIGNGF